MKPPASKKMFGVAFALLSFFLALPAAALVPSYVNPDSLTGIKIPHLIFGGVERDGTRVVIPWLAQYISAAYRYMIGIAVIAAIVMIMWGGFRYMVGSTIGDAKAGKETIQNAVSGLVILFAAYLILKTVNPATIALNNISVRYPDPGSGIYDDNADAGGAPIVSSPGTGKANKNAYDKLFQNYASCSAYDWRVLKALGLAESNLNVASTGGKTGKYKGLFQFDEDGCKGNTAIYPDSLGLDCGNLQDPETNTAAMAYRAHWALKKIRDICGNDLSTEEYILLLYTAHNTGPGVLKYVLENNGCHKDDQLKWVRQYPKLNEKYGALVPPDAAQKKWEYGEKVLRYFTDLGGTNVYGGQPSEQTCPLNTGERTPI